MAQGHWPEGLKEEDAVSSAEEEKLYLVLNPVWK